MYHRRSDMTPENILDVSEYECLANWIKTLTYKKTKLGGKI